MKKVLALLLTGAMALSLAGCGGQNAKKIYDDAAKKTAELDSMDVSSVIAMKMIQGEETVDISMDMDMKISGINTDSMKYQADANTTVMGQNQEISMYYEGGYYYMDAMGQKIKYAMDLDAMMEQIRQSTEGSSMDSSYLKDIQAKKAGENQNLTYTVDATKMDSYLQDIMGQMGTDAEGVTYNIKEASGEAVVNKDGYISKQKVKMVFEMELQGQTISMDMDVDSTYNNPGQTVEVTTPNLEGYEEVDASALQNQ
ncbi:MAG: hypothetical protein QM657_17945 [Lacrimispora sp.]|uniref:DUF6612 family protein n=1 Tax=Lacrimispora sp. TaxID=2719234 RepID=UPI0039E5CD7B